ncbi:RNA-binding protein 45 [Leptinotarsa decemlineata]|uniref:RNA-binding protein 45 n=1 Tax=Leptinotarsa decemlineata TaxID=7539 RepID=UPI000C253BD8|nr:RNA-binding protein 45 [Leptinotarsa decemlineata]
MSDRRFSGGSSLDDPPNSRLFIIGPKTLNEDDFRKAFDDFGDIEEIRVVKDRNTGENKGVFYVKFAKTSQAAKALEEKNGKIIGSGRAIKIMVASSREKGSKREENEEESLQRLFVVVPKNMTDDDLYDAFKDFGDIDYANIIRDRETRESKGFAYVKFTKFSEAATAFEQCDRRKFKPVFAEPRKSRDTMRTSFGSESGFRNSGPTRAPLMSPPRSNILPPPDRYCDNGFTRLTVIASPVVNQDQMWKLFDIVPSLDYCQIKYEGDRIRPTRALVEVVYTDPKWAAYAQEKLHGLEYPPGFRLIIKPEYEHSRSGYGKRPLTSPSSGSTSLSTNAQPDILKIAETIAQATSLIQAAGLSPDILQQKLGLMTEARKSEVFCSVKLPDVEPMANFDSQTEARCFIVCTPSALPGTVLKDVFCRFGNLIDVYMLNNRNCGYARYAVKQSAEDAIKTLHGSEVLGIRLKVIEAEERPEKRRRTGGDD